MKKTKSGMKVQGQVSATSPGWEMLPGYEAPKKEKRQGMKTKPKPSRMKTFSEGGKVESSSRKMLDMFKQGIMGRTVEKRMGKSSKPGQVVEEMKKKRNKAKGHKKGGSVRKKNV